MGSLTCRQTASHCSMIRQFSEKVVQILTDYTAIWEQGVHAAQLGDVDQHRQQQELP